MGSGTELWNMDGTISYNEAWFRYSQLHSGPHVLSSILCNPSAGCIFNPWCSRLWPLRTASQRLILSGKPVCNPQAHAFPRPYGGPAVAGYKQTPPGSTCRKHVAGGCRPPARKAVVSWKHVYKLCSFAGLYLGILQNTGVANDTKSKALQVATWL